MHVIALLLLIAAAPTSVFGQAQVAPGSPFPRLEAEDQHGRPFAFETGTRFVLVAFEMGTAKRANRYLDDQPEGFLDGRRAVYIADIHAMPGIGRAFALPKMRRYRHRIVLADEARLLDPLPRQAGRVTVLGVDDAGVVRTVDFWDPATALQLP